MLSLILGGKKKQNIQSSVIIPFLRDNGFIFDDVKQSKYAHDLCKQM